MTKKIKAIRDALEQGKIIFGAEIVAGHKAYDDVYSYFCKALATLDSIMAGGGYVMVPIDLIKSLVDAHKQSTVDWKSMRELEAMLSAAPNHGGEA